MSGFLFAAFLLFQFQTGAQIETGTITGRLLSEKGAPAVGVRMAAIPVTEERSAPVLVGITQTDEAGRYRLEDVPPGRYYIFAGLIDFPNYYPGTVSLTEARQVVVDPRSFIVDIDFSLPRPTTMQISGRLSSPPSASIVAAVLEPAGLGNRGARETVTVNPDGTFTFSDVTPGEYLLSTSSRGSIPLNVMVTDHDLENVIIPFTDCEAGVRVQGRLLGEPSVAIRQIQLRGETFRCIANGTVGADGVFNVTAVPEDSYLVDLTPQPIGWSPTNLRVSTENLEGVEISLPATFEIRGRVTVEDGSPLPRLVRGATIPVEARSGGLIGLRATPTVTQAVGADGSFLMRVLKGNYTIALSAVPTGYYVKSMVSGPLDLLLRSLEVGDGLESEVQIVLGVVREPDSGVRVAGRVIPAVEGALQKPESVVLVPAAGRRDASFFTATLDGDGAFEFHGVEPGQYDLHTFPDSPVALRAIRVGILDVTELELAMPVLFKLNGAIEWIQASLSGAPDPPENVSIQFQRRSGSNTNISSWAAFARSGTFHIYLPEGDYRFSITGMPEGSGVASATFGETDLLEKDLHVGAGLDPADVRIRVRR